MAQIYGCIFPLHGLATVQWAPQPYQGKFTRIDQEPYQNLSALKPQWTYSLSWSEWTVYIFLLQCAAISAKLEIQDLAKFTATALNYRRLSIFLLNQETAQMRKVVLQNRMAFNILTSAQGETCILIKEYCTDSFL